jgi:hypothetical protein
MTVSQWRRGCENGVRGRVFLATMPSRPDTVPPVPAL